MAAGGTSIMARISPENRRQLAATLPAAHVAVLRGMLDGGLMKLAVTPEISDSLISSGYARQALGGLILTDVGQLRAHMENT